MEIMALPTGCVWVGDERTKHGYLALCPDLLSGVGSNGGELIDSSLAMRPERPSTN